MSIQLVRTQIRFALEQLKAQNKHHGFEDIAREFTRQRICRNLLPATGPVGGGGDQGRDFETYKTYFDDGFTINDTKLFEGVSNNGNVFFACSLQEKIVSKIKLDIKSIFSHTSEKRPVTYFCVEDVPITKRNKLIQWCQDEYDTNLQIFDGQALSENLSDPDIFWVAVEFLHIPSEIYPKSKNGDEWYAEYRKRWIEQDTQPINFSDFCQIKYGLRKATFREKLRPDLPAWMNAIKKFLEDGNPNVKRKVQYEICVVALRGQNNLTAYKNTVIDYFKDIEEISDPEELTDVGVLLSYCSSAKAYGQFDIDAAYLHAITKSFVDCVDKFLKKVKGINTRCILLEIKARSCLLQFLESDVPGADIDEAFEYWYKLIQLVEHAPLFPLEQFSDVLGVLTPYMGTDPRFLELTNKLDGLLAKRTGGFIAAEKCRDRAVAFYKNGNIVQAIDHLHRAKISWFSAETLRGTIITSRFIADCYNQLGLMYAAKYYLLSSFYLAFHSKDEDVLDLVSRSLFQAAEIFYRSGEWLSFFAIMQVALLSHHHYDHEPLDIVEHNSLQKVFFYAVIIRTLSQRFWNPASEFVKKQFEDWALDDGTREELVKLSDDQSESSYWLTTPIEDIWRQIEENLAGKPFNDIGETRTIIWKALGIEWEVCFSNDYEITRVTEEFVAVLQVVLADLAQDDFQLLPVHVKINASLSEDKGFHVIEKFGNQRLEWDLGIPAFKNNSQNVMDDRTSQVFAYAVSVLGFCTTLKRSEYHARIEKSLGKGLSSKTFFARSYPEIYGEIITPDMFNEERRGELEPIEADRSYHFCEHDQLTWCNTPGFLYSQDEASLHAKNRYKRLSNLVKIIWPKILSSKEHREYFQELHDRGYLDWHLALIGCNAVANHVANKKTWAGVADDTYMQAVQEIVMSVINGEMNKEIEQLDIKELSTDDLKFQEKTSFVSIMKTWQLFIHTPTPDFDAIRRFMEERYKIFDIDTPHDPLFTRN
jgi:hypothetical protein